MIRKFSVKKLEVKFRFLLRLSFCCDFHLFVVQDDILNCVRQFAGMHTMRHYLFFLIYRYFSLLSAL